MAYPARISGRRHRGRSARTRPTTGGRRQRLGDPVEQAQRDRPAPSESTSAGMSGYIISLARSLRTRPAPKDLTTGGRRSLIQPEAPANETYGQSSKSQRLRRGSAAAIVTSPRACTLPECADSLRPPRSTAGTPAWRSSGAPRPRRWPGRVHRHQHLDRLVERHPRGWRPTSPPRAPRAQGRNAPAGRSAPQVVEHPLLPSISLAYSARPSMVSASRPPAGTTRGCA